MGNWSLKRTAQCVKCPWMVRVNPHDIPNGYSPKKHRALKSTIAQPKDNLFERRPAMACHETHDAHCIGWLVNQIGSGNNIPLRMLMTTCSNAREIKLLGEQHETFDATLPQEG